MVAGRHARPIICMHAQLSAPGRLGPKPPADAGFGAWFGAWFGRDGFRPRGPWPRRPGRRRPGREDPARDAASGKSWVSWGISGPGCSPEPRPRSKRPSTSRSERSERHVRTRVRSARTRARSVRRTGARSELGEPAAEGRAATVEAPVGSGTPEMTLPAPCRGRADGSANVAGAQAHAFQCIGKIRPERGSIQAIADSVGGSDPSKIARAQAVDDPGWRARRNCGYFETS